MIDRIKISKRTFCLVLAGAILCAAMLFWAISIYPYLRIERAHLAAPYLEIRADCAGRLTSAPSVEGAIVQQGEVIFSLCSEEEKIKQKQMQTNMESLQEALAFHLADLEKAMQDYLEVKSDTELGIQEADAYEKPLQILNERQLVSNECKERLNIARENLMLITQQMQQKSLTAPFTGVVVRQQKREGDVVQFGDVICSFCDVHQIWVEAIVPESSIPKLAVGQSAMIRLPSDYHQKWRGTVSWISPVALPSGDGVPVKISLDSNDCSYLKPNMSAEVTINTKYKTAR